MTTGAAAQPPVAAELPDEKVATVKVSTATETAEGRRLLETHGKLLWRRWGPYVSERSCGTVREDYSLNGAAWDFLSHDAARSKAYRWGEDGMPHSERRYLATPRRDEPARHRRRWLPSATAISFTASALPSGTATTPSSRSVSESLAGKYVELYDVTDRPLEVRWKGVSLPYRIFQRVNHTAIVENKRLGHALALVKAQQENSPEAGD
jgi:hypothetical protein